jgi:acyl-CoA synthetase (NDP forming)
MGSTDFHRLLQPASVAVAGAGGNPTSMGARTLGMIGRYGFQGALYAINPKGKDCGQWPGYTGVAELPETPDLCIVAVPPTAAVEVVAECGRRGVPFVQVLTTGSEGSLTFDESLVAATTKGTRVLGPNCVGTHSPAGGVTFVEGPSDAVGSAAIISQSGGLSLDFVNQAASRGLPLRAVISAGNCADVSLAELVDHFATEDATSVVGIYLEGVADGRLFVEAIRRATRHKPVVILKGGRTLVGSASAASHTGAVAVPHSTWLAAMRQAGVICADTPDDFLAKLSVFDSRVPSLDGDQLAVLGNGGGMTVLSTDALSDGGLSLTRLSEQTERAIRGLDSPPGATLGNPADIPAGALNLSGTETLSSLLEHVLSDPGVFGALVHFNLVALLNYPDPRSLAVALADLLRHGEGAEKPIYAALRSTPEAESEALRRVVLDTCREARIPVFQNGIEAAVAASAARVWRRWLDRPSTAGAKAADEDHRAHGSARSLLRDAVADSYARGESALPTVALIEALGSYGIASAKTCLVTSTDHAVSTFAEFDGAVAMKVEAEGLTHKSDVDGVRLNITDMSEVAKAFEELERIGHHEGGRDHFRGVLMQQMVEAPAIEVLVGMHRDPVLGVTVLVGLGGVLVEVLGDVTARLAPVSVHEADEMLDELRSASILAGFRGARPRDRTALCELIARFSVLASDCPAEVTEIDLNPVLVLSEGGGALSVDARCLLQSAQ